MLPPCEIENGPADRVGCTRVFPLAGGHRETLASLDDRRRTLAFTFADNAGGLPVRQYRSQLTARPVTVSNHTYVEWSSEFDCDEADTAKVVAQVRDGVLLPGLTALADRFAPPAEAFPTR
jgi:hypothetical protein